MGNFNSISYAASAKPVGIVIKKVDYQARLESKAYVSITRQQLWVWRWHWCKGWQWE